MLKLSKNHNLKTADDKKEEKLDDKPEELDGASVEDVDDALEQEGFEDEDADKAGEQLDAVDNSKGYDARREAATPHANAAKDLYAKRRELMGQVNMLDDQLAKHREVLRALDPKMKHEAYADDKELRLYLKPAKALDDKKKKKKKKLDKKSEQDVLDGLLKVAEVLDYAGDLEGVSLVENVINIFAKEKSDGMPKYDVETVEKIEREYPNTQPYAPTMSTRNCPDHYGAQMKRIAEGSFQCELDGKVYNWNQGFKDYSGNVYPAAPIRSVDFPDTTERMFETREMATSKNNK